MVEKKNTMVNIFVCSVLEILVQSGVYCKYVSMGNKSRLGACTPSQCHRGLTL